jgi:hypothetical protein
MEIDMILKKQIEYFGLAIGLGTSLLSIDKSAFSLSIMRRYFIFLLCSIANIIILDRICPAIAKPPAIEKSALSARQPIDLKLAIDRFFKTGTLEESWFALKELKSPEQFAEFHKQALDARKIALTLFGTYKNVRSQTKTSYIATFDRRELAIEFQIDPQGRITALSAK